MVGADAVTSAPGWCVVRVTGPRLLAAGLVLAVGWAAQEVGTASSSTAAAMLPGVSPVATDAYSRAGAAVPASCGYTWQLGAAIGAVETGHGTFGDSTVGAQGKVDPPIRGPRLDGIEFHLILDTDDGVLDGDPVYDRAVGPMQFIPQTWDAYSEPGDDPQNIFDASRATARLLCAVAANEGRPLSDAAVEEAAIRAYNNSGEYVRTVREFRDDFMRVAPGTGAPAEGVTAKAVASKLGQEGRRRWASLGTRIEAAPGTFLDRAFDVADPMAGLVWTTLDGEHAADLDWREATKVHSGAVSSGDLVTVGGITVDASIGDQLGRMIDAAAADGVTLAGSGHRTYDEQVELRRRHCGPTDYDVFERPSGECSPPTAKPGTSMHETGLAIDFDLDHPGSFGWLQGNAGRFGFYNLPSEPWHWSTTGN